MRQYWVKIAADAQADGPIDAAELRRRVTSRELSRDALVSIDHSLWYRAERMKGLAFPSDDNGEVAVEAPPAAPRIRRPIHRSIPPSYPGMAAPVQPTQPPIAATEPVYLEVPADAPAADAPAADADHHPIEATPFDDSPMESASTLETQPPALEPIAPPVEAAAKRPRPATPLHAWQPHAPIRPRSVRAFWLLASLVVVLHLVIFYLLSRNFLVRPLTDARDPEVILLRAIAAVNLIASITALVLWLIWLNRTHRDMHRLTGGRYPISPDKAIGLSFVPLFNIYWSVHVPSQLCGELNHHLRAAGLPEVSKRIVKACHILGIVLFIPIPALTAILYAVSMSKIQGGLNRLAKA